MRKTNGIGIILILVGVIWIIHQTGIISINWMASIRLLWPLFLVAIGIGIIAGGRKRIVWGVWILTFILFMGVGIYKKNDTGKLFDSGNKLLSDSDLVSRAKRQPVTEKINLSPDTEEGCLLLKLGAVKLNVSSGDEDIFVNVQSNIPNLRQRLVEGRRTLLEYDHEQMNTGNTIRNFDIQLNPDIVWEMDATMGAVDGSLDFSQIPLKHLVMTLGAGSLNITMGKQPIETKMEFRTGAAGLNIYIPENSGLKVKSGKVLSEISFHNLTMNREEQVYLSENYEEAEQKIEMDIQSAVSSIHIFAQ